MRNGGARPNTTEKVGAALLMAGSLLAIFHRDLSEDQDKKVGMLAVSGVMLVIGAGMVAGRRIANLCSRMRDVVNPRVLNAVQDIAADQRLLEIDQRDHNGQRELLANLLENRGLGEIAPRDLVPDVPGDGIENPAAARVGSNPERSASV
ncbi:MAG: hypothetical protein K0R25_960 [Rickettsiaceae bacterium]|jgi:hypothetical protein|nr:hypothetical protein [Rickettsiaceae bacterium]